LGWERFSSSPADQYVVRSDFSAVGGREQVVAGHRSVCMTGCRFAFGDGFRVVAQGVLDSRKRVEMFAS
jgi:hypothetical protein